MTMMPKRNLNDDNDVKINHRWLTLEVWVKICQDEKSKIKQKVFKTRACDFF